MTLYTRQVGNAWMEPAALPFRVELAGGFTRTDPATFTPEELDTWGYVAAPDQPPGTVWDSVAGEWVEAPEPEPQPEPTPTLTPFYVAAMAMLALDQDGNPSKLDADGFSAFSEFVPGAYSIGLYPEIEATYFPEVRTDGLRADYMDVTPFGFTVTFTDPVSGELARPAGNIDLKIWRRT